jgi:hypothetical protein
MIAVDCHCDEQDPSHVDAKLTDSRSLRGM